MLRIGAVLMGLALSLLGLGCFAKAQRAAAPPQFRTIDAEEPTRFHKPIRLEVAWYPYHAGQAATAGKHVWTIVREDSSGTMGVMPVILVSYPDSSEGVWLDLDTDDALLGRLLKHSLMTEIPLKRPFTEFLQEADCGKCHPAEIKIRR